MARPKGDLADLMVPKGEAAAGVPHSPLAPAAAPAPVPDAAGERALTVTVKVPVSAFNRLEAAYLAHRRATGQRMTHQAFFLAAVMEALDRAEGKA